MLRNVLPCVFSLALLATIGSSELFVWAETAPQSAETQSTELIKCAPYLQGMSQESVIITWHTSQQAYSWVDYWETGAPETKKTAQASTYGLKNVGTAQAVTLAPLKPGTSYTYEINSKEVKRILPYKFTFGVEEKVAEMKGKPLSFTTWPALADNFSFIMINDLHDNNSLHRALLDKCGLEESAFVCYNGDIVTDKNTEDEIFNKFLDIPIELFAWQKGFFMLRGNHETRGAMSRSIHNYFPTANDQFYYTFQYGDVFFVNLDCGEDKVDTSNEYGGLVDFDSYRTEQMKWLEQVVQMPEYQNARYRVFFCHIPPTGGGAMDVQVDVITPGAGVSLLSIGSDEMGLSVNEPASENIKTGTTLSGAPWHGDIEIRDKFLPFMLKNKGDLLLCGHTHKLYNCNYRSGDYNLPVLINGNDAGVRIDVSPEKMVLRVIKPDGSVVTSKVIVPRR